MSQAHDSGRLPDFIGIGAMKSASAWLYQCLVAHPEVAEPRRKEVNFFSDARAYARGIDHYARFFSGCPLDKITGEFSPTYMYAPETAARMGRWLPRIRIIACLRDPVERAFSQYRFSLEYQGRLSLYATFGEAVERDGEIVGRGRYGEQLERYYQVFPSENILVLMYDEVLADPAEVLRRLYAFIGAAHTSFRPPMVNRRVHRTGSFEIVERIPAANRLLYALRHRVRSGGALERLAISSGAAAMARQVIKANRIRVAVDGRSAQQRPQPILDPETADRLYALYREDGERLRLLLGRDIPWLDRTAVGS